MIGLFSETILNTGLPVVSYLKVFLRNHLLGPKRHNKVVCENKMRYLKRYNEVKTPSVTAAIGKEDIKFLSSSAIIHH